MNKKLKCLLSAVLVLVMLMSAAITVPVTAAENEEKPITAAVTEEAAVENVPTEETSEAPTEDSSDVFVDGRDDLESIANDEEEATLTSEKEEIELAQTGEGSGINSDIVLFRKGFYTNKIELKWTNLKDVDGYRVYWCDMTKENAPKKLLTTVKDSTVTVTNLKQGAKYRFAIRPYIKDGGNIVEGKATAVTAATIPAAVKNFRLKSAAQAGTVIKWSRVKNIDGYVLFRLADGKWSTYKYLSPDAIEFKDTKVKAGKAYYYRIISYRKDTRGYLISDPALLRTVCGLCAPADRGSVSRGNRVYLSWRDIPFATGYQVYYSLDNKDYHGVAITSNNYCTTKKFKEGTKVYFRIRPYRLVGQSKTQVLGTVSQFSVKVLANSFGADVGDTYVEIDISEQHMWYIVKGEVYVSTPVVTGNNNSMDTPTGIFSVRNKARNVSLVGPGYVSFVEYWIAFIGSSYGIHDASWRSSFGGSIYKGNGSHGCVNTPYDAEKKIYNKITVGTPVVIHK